jgi:archaeal type IV pilus assembly protein PilA
MNFRKMKRNFRRNTKAISPVIATLLMIAIAVVASLVTYAWVMGYMGFTTGKTGKAIQIQSISNSTTAGTLTIYVQNVGDSALTFDSVFINGTMASKTDPLYSINLPTLGTGQTATIIVPNPQSPAPISYTLTVKVTTTDGTFSQVTKQFP